MIWYSIAIIAMQISWKHDSHLMQNLRLRRLHPPIVFTWIVRLVKALQLCHWQFSHKETLQQTFFKQSAILHGKQPLCGFEPPLGGLGTTYNVHLRLIGEHIVYFLLVLIELFSLGVTNEAIRAKIDYFVPMGSAWPKISGRSGHPHQLFFFSEN